MAECNKTLPTVTLVDSTIEVASKVKILTDQVLGTDSVYMRAKDTLKSY